MFLELACTACCRERRSHGNLAGRQPAGAGSALNLGPMGAAEQRGVPSSVTRRASAVGEAATYLAASRYGVTGMS